MFGGEDANAGTVPDEDTIRRLEVQWLPPAFCNCLKKTYPDCGGPATCGERCSAEYWLAHSASVAQMMRGLARLAGEDEHLWEVIGRLHDLDYLAGPHHDLSVANEEAHPVAITEWLYENGAPLGMTLAILQHSLHLGIPPSLPVCCALVAADEHGTMKGAGIKPVYPVGTPPEFIRALEAPPRVPFSGYRRSNMNQRAADALLSLARTWRNGY